MLSYLMTMSSNVSLGEMLYKGINNYNNKQISTNCKVLKKEERLRELLKLTLPRYIDRIF